MKALQKLLKEYERLWALDYALALMNWDSETYMPEGAVRERGEASAVLSSMKKSIYTSDRFVRLVERLEEEAEGDVEKGIVRVLKREIHYYKSLPEELLKKKSRLTKEAFVAWKRAKEKSNFSEFEPYLERLVELAREMAEYLGYESHPYNALLDLYEEGFTIDDADRLFNGLKPLRKELERILDSGWPTTHPFEDMSYPKQKMESLNKELLDILGFDWRHQRVDTSPHPFTQEIGLFDVRITTWYHPKDFKRSLLAVIHEFGHALYERQCDPSLWKTPVCGGVSLGIHESQSRFWENYVGRSVPFSELITSAVKRHLGISVSPDDLFIYFNVVRPSPIRVEADEVTYHLHILIRYEIEKDLIDGSLEAKDLPDVWNEKMEKYLGIIPKNDREGVLQDVHWSHGAFGYFPTYSIGSILAVQIGKAMEKKLDIQEAVLSGDLSLIREWLKDKIHRWGSIYPPKDLIRRFLGEELNPSTFLRYVREKYA